MMSFLVFQPQLLISEADEDVVFQDFRNLNWKL